MSEPNKHHYLPVFYLNQWAGSDGKLVRYHRPFRDVVASPITPANTGYEERLYRLEGYRPQFTNAVEKEYMAKVVDDPAAKALKVILGDDYSKMKPEIAVNWTRFLMSLLFRTPHMVEHITKEAERNLRNNFQKNPEDYDSVRTDAHPPTLMGWVERYTPTLFTEAGKSFLPGIIDNPKVGNAILQMGWWTWTLDDQITFPDLLTSDSPVFMSHGLKYDSCVIALPISPRRAFFATRNSATFNGLIAHGPARVAKELNASMVNQAQKAVFGSSDRHLRFVENRLRRVSVEPAAHPRRTLTETSDGAINEGWIGDRPPSPFRARARRVLRRCCTRHPCRRR
jgi:hypothetical protein